MKKALVIMFGLILAGCSGSERFKPVTVDLDNKKIESYPLPPVRPSNTNTTKKCWIETETTPHAVIERRYCR